MILKKKGKERKNTLLFKQQKAQELTNSGETDFRENLCCLIISKVMTGTIKTF